MLRTFPNPVVTLLPVYASAIYMARRSQSERNFPGKWAFPGGKVETGETFLDALVRELYEETSLPPRGDVAFLDTYAFGTSVGVAFAVWVTSNDTGTYSSNERWVKNERELQHLDRIPGIDNHFMMAQRALNTPACWLPIEKANLIDSRYLNR